MRYVAVSGATTAPRAVEFRCCSRRFPGDCWCWCTGAVCSRDSISRIRCTRLADEYPAALRPLRRGEVYSTSMSRRRYARKTIHYGPHRANVADIWMRPDLPRDGKAPVLVQIPGGAWMIGMRRRSRIR